MPKWIPFFFLFLLIPAWYGLAKPLPDSGQQLAKADSLFNQKLYTQAASVYEGLLNQQQFYSPALLLKLAYIKEALGEYSLALYYLQLYHQRHPGRSVLKKMELLAEQHNLEGYAYSDLDLLATFIGKYYWKALEIMLMLAAVMLTLIVLKRTRGVKLPLTALVGYLGYLLLLAYYLNLLSLGRYGIVNQERLSMMSGPSAASSYLKTLPRGSRVQLLAEEDIWNRVRFQDTIGYLRSYGLLQMPER
jgi:hypothetical protein